MNGEWRVFTVVHGDLVMAGIIVRNLDDRLKRRLRIQAAEHCQSREE